MAHVEPPARIVELFSADRLSIAAQVLSLLHVPLAAIATVLVLRKRTEVAGSLWAVLLVTWLVPTIGPLCVIIGLARLRGARTDRQPTVGPVSP